MNDPLVQLNVRVRRKQHLGKIKRLSILLKRKDPTATESELIRRAIDKYNPK